MAAYKDLVGQKITKVTSNPGEPKTGQMWYNSTDGKLRGLAVVEAFSSGANMITARRGVAGSFAGSQSSGLGFGGYTGSNTGLALTEEYNGSGWATGGALNKARYSAGGAGTQTAGLCFGGYSNPNQDTEVEEYNGTSWSEETDLPTAISSFACAVGTQTAALNAGGMPAPRTTTFEYDGSSWTATGALNTARQSGFQGAGTQTAAFAAGGDIGGSPGVSLATEEYDGSSWTSVSNCPPTIAVSAAGSGTQTDAILMKGTNSATYDGTNFTAGPSMANDFISKVGNGATTSTAMAFSGNTSGNPTSYTGTTEEFNRSTNTITAAAWASGPALGTGRYSGVSGGTTTAAILAGGGYPRDKNETELYDGTSWSEVNNMNSGRGRLSGTGTPSSAVGAGGYTPGSYSSAAEQWDGTNWSNITSLPQNRQYMGSIGASGSAALFIGGNSPGTTQTNETLYWNGSSWATGGNYPNTVWNPRGFGTISAGISCGGNNGPTTSSNSYNGSSWTSGPSLNVARDNCGASGATDGDGLIYGGGSELTAEKWDGTSFTTSASFANSHNGGGSNQNGSSSTAMIFGDAPAGTAFEEFTGETETANIKDFTTS